MFQRSGCFFFFYLYDLISCHDLESTSFSRAKDCKLKCKGPKQNTLLILRSTVHLNWFYGKSVFYTANQLNQIFLEVVQIHKNALQRIDRFKFHHVWLWTSTFEKQDRQHVHITSTSASCQVKSNQSTWLNQIFLEVVQIHKNALQRIDRFKFHHVWLWTSTFEKQDRQHVHTTSTSASCQVKSNQSTWLNQIFLEVVQIHKNALQRIDRFKFHHVWLWTSTFEKQDRQHVHTTSTSASCQVKSNQATWLNQIFLEVVQIHKNALQRIDRFKFHHVWLWTSTFEKQDRQHVRTTSTSASCQVKSNQATWLNQIFLEVVQIHKNALQRIDRFKFHHVWLWTSTFEKHYLVDLQVQSYNTSSRIIFRF